MPVSDEKAFNAGVLNVEGSVLLEWGQDFVGGENDTGSF